MRRDFLASACGAGVAAWASPLDALGAAAPSLGFRFTDVTAQADLRFQHSSGAYGGKLLPETLGSGCAFLDFDGDGWQDILLINAMDWPGHKRQRSTLRLYRNNRNGTFADVTRNAGLDIEMYGMGVAVGDYNNDGFPQHRKGHVYRRHTRERAARPPGVQHLSGVVRLRSRWILGLVRMQLRALVARARRLLQP
jgi:hypothetical protein